VARLVGQKLSEAWGQPVIVDNRPGGNTIIGTEAAAKSAPDGYTILLAASTHTINALLYDNLPYDSVKDFAPVATLVKIPYILVLNASVAANNLQEFIALARSKPGQLNYATSGSGNLNHLAGELLSMLTEIRMQPVPYKGGGPALSGLLGGQVQLQISNPVSFIPHVKSGKLKAIAVTGESRLAALPQVPTFIEVGLPDFDINTWQGVLAPARTPRAVIDRLSTEMGRMLATADVREKLANQGMEPFFSSPEQFAALIDANLTKFAKIIKTANIKLE